MLIKIRKTVLILLRGDITEQETDAIVNAANQHLILGGGVAGTIRRKGGEQIQKECNMKVGDVHVGGAVITKGGRLKARYVIHAVGPRMGEGNEDQKLKNSTLNSLRLADSEGLKSLAFPAISTGSFGFPMERCAQIMLDTVYNYLLCDSQLKRVVFCLFDDASLAIFKKQLTNSCPNL